MDTLPFERSFASHPKSQFWSNKNGEISPRQVFKSSDKKYWFDCDVCHHLFETSLGSIANNRWCSYCASKQLCDDNNCQSCFNNSFASHEKSPFWNEVKNGEISPRQVFKSSHKKYWFDCNICNHSFEMSLGSIANNRWCLYCASKQLCDDNNCQSCFNNSFASHEKSQFWSNKNENIVPRQVFKSSDKKYWFDCNICNHLFEASLNHVTNMNSWCSYCSNKILCTDEECQSCFNNSFESHEKSQVWSNKNGEILPRQIFKSSHKKYWFDCDVCHHSFEMLLNNVTGNNQWCPYCSNTILCTDEECQSCFNKSFASHEKSQFWSNKNENIVPRQVFKSSNKKYWFDCDVCNHSFESSLHSITGNNRWCPKCKNKTEKMLYDELIKIYPSIIHQFKQDWCKNKQCLPFDFCIEEHKIIIELDGPQHFCQVSNWSSPEEQLINDKFKEQCANDNNYSVIRILQEDVYYNKNDWLTILTNSINELIINGNVENHYIGVNDEYINHS